MLKRTKMWSIQLRELIKLSARGQRRQADLEWPFYYHYLLLPSENGKKKKNLQNKAKHFFADGEGEVEHRLPASMSDFKQK